MHSTDEHVCIRFSSQTSMYVSFVIYFCPAVITLAGCYFGAVLYGVLNSALSDVIFLSNVSRKYPGTW